MWPAIQTDILQKSLQFINGANKNRLDQRKIISCLYKWWRGIFQTVFDIMAETYKQKIFEE